MYSISLVSILYNYSILISFRMIHQQSQSSIVCVFLSFLHSKTCISYSNLGNYYNFQEILFRKKNGIPFKTGEMFDDPW